MSAPLNIALKLLFLTPTITQTIHGSGVPEEKSSEGPPLIDPDIILQVSTLTTLLLKFDDDSCEGLIVRMIIRLVKNEHPHLNLPLASTKDGEVLHSGYTGLTEEGELVAELHKEFIASNFNHPMRQQSLRICHQLILVLAMAEGHIQRLKQDGGLATVKEVKGTQILHWFMYIESLRTKYVVYNKRPSRLLHALDLYKILTIIHFEDYSVPANVTLFIYSCVNRWAVADAQSLQQLAQEGHTVDEIVSYIQQQKPTPPEEELIEQAAYAVMAAIFDDQNDLSLEDLKREIAVRAYSNREIETVASNIIDEHMIV